MDLVLHTDASYRNDLDTGKFARMLDDPSQCYKFYWLEAILNLLPTEEGDISFEKIIGNYPIIKGWIQMKKVRFLQDRNPGVPGIIYKLVPENENGRKLSNAKALWKEVAEVLATPIHDIYSGHEIDVRKSDLDHFVPWSFVANDELWDLIPMERRLNSSKSNRLPEWDLYFGNMAALQYKMYETVFSHEQIQKAFEKCRRDNLNAMWAIENLYIPRNTEEQFTNILEHNLRPVCVVAPRTGAAAGRGVPSTDACTRSGRRALRVLEIWRNGAYRNVERPPVLRHDRAEGRSIDSDGRRRKYRSVLDLRGCARGPAKPEVAECDLSEGI